MLLIIFLCTPPHFWPLSLARAGEYARAGVPMLPVVAGRAETGRQILLYTVALVPVTFAPVLLGFAGLAYGLVAVVTGPAMVAPAGRVWAAHDEGGRDQ